MPFSKSAVALAREILEEAERNGEADVDQQDSWKAKYRVQDKCAQLVKEVLGPLEYITHVAGPNFFPSGPQLNAD